MIHIITGCTKNQHEMTDITYPILQKYVSRYDHMSLTIHDIPDDYSSIRPYSWFKVPAILDAFKDQTVDHVCWIDSDTLIINQYLDIQTLITSNKHLYISRDFNNLNAGIMMWSNTEYSKSILEKLWSMTDYIDSCWWEQTALIDLYEKNYNLLKKYTNIVPQNIFNAYEYRSMHVIQAIVEEQMDIGQATNESWVLHMPGLTMEERLHLIKHYIEVFKLL